MSRKKKFKKIFSQIKLYLIILIVFLALTCVSLGYVRARLLSNARESGTSLAATYAVEEQNNISLYSTLLELGTKNIDEHAASGASEAEMWIADYLNGINTYFGDSFDPLAVIDGKCIFANPRQDPEAYDYASEEWYKMAEEADGKVIFTDIHDDAYVGGRVITAAKKADNSDSVVAFNIFPESFNYFGDRSSVPEGGRYYLCDSSGELI